MPKRPPTPPPPDDSLFFTVVNPYPEQPHQSDQCRKVFARWIASIVGQQRLYAFYHRPKSPSMVIIEVSKDDFAELHFRRLLGEHRWSAILKTPDNAVAKETSSIFPCTLSTPRSLQKECWQKVDIEASWLHRWSPEEDSDIVYPYPLPGFCQPPPEDVMRNPLCRPLRATLFDDTKEVTWVAQQSARALFPYRSMSAFDPDDDFDSDYDDSSSDGLLPTPFGVTPPGLAPLPSPISSPPFAPAIHGADTPKSDSVKIVPHPGSGADTQGEALWAGYGEIDAPPPADQCRVHGYMCTSGICRQQGLRKHDAIKEEREQKRRQERNDWFAQRDARQDSRRDRGTRRRGSGSGGSGGERDGRPSWTTRGRDGWRAHGAFSSSAGADSMAMPVAPPRPPHLLKKTTKATGQAAGSRSSSSPSPSSDGSSSGGKNWSRGAPLVPPARKRWADMLDDEDEDDDDDEEGERDGLDYLPRGVFVTELPGEMYRKDNADAESVFSGWDEDAEPF